MINIKKCKFLVKRLQLLGYALYDYKFQLGDKVMKKWLEVGVPSTFKGIQALVGKMNFAAPFIVDYK